MDEFSESGGRPEAGRGPVYASYGKSCLNCVRSKTRCALSGIDEKCHRCYRLNKECQRAPTLRKKRASRKPPLASPIAANSSSLEEKLDGIVQLLQRSQASGSIAPSSAMQMLAKPQNQLGNVTVDPSADYCLVHGPPTPAASHVSTAPDTTIGCCSRATALPVPDFSDYPAEDESELEEYLETYRTKMVAFFPIVCIRPQVKMKDLMSERPFLSLIIRAICSKNLTRQAALGREIRKEIGKKILEDGAKNLDLFLGLLVLAAWGHMYIFNNGIISTVVQLGMSLAFDLGLTKPAPVDPVSVMVMLNYSAQGCPRPVNYASSSVRTMEERRAIIGLFLISSITAHFFQRIEPLRWSPYLEECLQILEEKRDFPTDLLLVYLVRVQVICNKIAAAPWNDTFGILSTKVPSDFYTKALKSQLQDLKRSIPVELQSNDTLQLHILGTVLSLHEHSLSTASSKNISSDPNTHLEHIENLWTCLTTTKAWFAIFFSLDSFPVASYPQVSMAILAQMAHCIIALFRVNTFESPDFPWDRQRAIQEMDFGNVVKIMTERWSRIHEEAGLTLNTPIDKAIDPWTCTNRRITGMANWWEAKLGAMAAAEREGDNSQGILQNGLGSASVGLGQPQMDGIVFPAVNMNMDFLDDIWIRDLLGGGTEYTMESYM